MGYRSETKLYHITLLSSSRVVESSTNSVYRSVSNAVAGYEVPCTASSCSGADCPSFTRKPTGRNRPVAELSYLKGVEGRAAHLPVLHLTPLCVPPGL